MSARRTACRESECAPVRTLDAISMAGFAARTAKDAVVCSDTVTFGPAASNKPKKPKQQWRAVRCYVLNPSAPDDEKILDVPVYRSATIDTDVRPTAIVAFGRQVHDGVTVIFQQPVHQNKNEYGGQKTEIIMAAKAYVHSIANSTDHPLKAIAQATVARFQ